MNWNKIELDDESLSHFRLFTAYNMW
jgi:hypothetical protein